MQPAEMATFTRIYRVDLSRRAFYLGVWVFFALLLSLLSLAESDPASRSAIRATTAILLAIGAAMSPLVWYPKLIVTPRGIEVRQVGWRIGTGWENIDWIDRSSLRGAFLKDPVKGPWGLRVGLYIPFFFDRQERELVATNRWIPLAPFSSYLQSRELDQDILRCAPRPEEHDRGLLKPS